MSNSKISSLTSATTPLAGTETVPVVQSSATKQVTVANLTAGRAVSALSYSAGNLSIAGNAITSTSGTVELRPAASGFATIGAAINANWAGSFYGLSGGDLYSISIDGSNSNSFALASNAYRTASGTPGTWKYAGSSTATLYAQDRGRHNFYSAASGTINGAITWVPVISTSATGGDVTVNTGNLVQGTAAKGVNFTANTPAAGMTSQLLNWYEEGTWTPTIGAGSGTITTVGTLLGKYNRKGREITLFFSLAITTNGSASGFIFVDGLPFTASTSLVAHTGCGLSGASDKGLGVILNTSQNRIYIRVADGAYPGSDGAVLYGQITYLA
jgi:hypothetical protein